MIDVSKIKVGDKVVIEATVVRIDPEDEDLPLGLQYGDDPTKGWEWCGTAGIISHTPAPREFKAGDKVTWGHGDVVYEFRERRGDASVLWREDYGYLIYSNGEKFPLRHADE